MAWLSKVASSLFSASNENTLALASVKFDFSLVKVEAPVEFNPLGKALSRTRKANAEDGGYHRTARRLGALFEQLIPSTPRLVGAYGKRVSEIINTPGINPEGEHRHGPFQRFIGADATAIWAAATSSTAAISIYLLACLLANVWDPNEATSIWVELVAERKKAILKAFVNNSVISEASIYSAQQEITREELSLWDASARSWLRSADQAKQQEKDQAMLILKNIILPYPAGRSPYEAVLQMWREALIGIEELLNERPQRILNKSVPEAILSWHLYPDMIVLGKEIKNVQYNDSLFTATGTCTIGLESRPIRESSGTEWSLILSHLTFYGRPQEVKSYDSSRMPFAQFRIVVLGSLFAAWSVPSSDICQMAVCVQELWRVLSPLAGNTAQVTGRASGCAGLGWLQNLATAASTVVQADDRQDSPTIQLVNFGWRRGRRLLQSFGEPKDHLVPLFGLGNPILYQALTHNTDLESGIHFLRELSREIGLREGEGIIVSCHSQERETVYEVASARPINVASGKRDSDGNSKPLHRHFRWFVPRCGHQAEVGSSIDRKVDVDARSKKSIFASVAAEALSKARHIQDTESSAMRYFKQRTSFFESIASSEKLVEPQCNEIDGMYETQCDEIDRTYRTLCGCTWRSNRWFPTSDKPDRPLEVQQEVVTDADFRLLLGDQTLGLFIHDKVFSPVQQLREIETALSTSRLLHQLAKSQAVCPSRLYDYLVYISTPKDKGPESQRVDSGYTQRGLKLIARKFVLPYDFCRCLIGFNLACTVFNNLSGATISTKFVTSGQSLSKTDWFPSSPTPVLTNNADSRFPDKDEPFRYSSHSYSLTRAQTFACLLHFATGSQDIQPEHLEGIFAVSVENSLYVAETLLSDPSVEVPQHSVQRLTGNIGQSGISLLIGVKNPEIGQPGNDYSLVKHEAYDYARENNYLGTSLHLSLTGWSVPLLVENSIRLRTIDQNVRYVESVISVQDHGKHISDLELPDYANIHFERPHLIELNACATPSHVPSTKLGHQYISIDDWEELFDPPLEGVSIIRARGNWAARLAAAAILAQKQSNFALICGEHFCLACLEKYYDCSGLTLID